MARTKMHIFPKEMFTFFNFLTWILIKQVTMNELDAMKNCLLELRMSELLRLQHSLQSMKSGEKEENSSLARQHESERLNDTKKVKSALGTSETCVSQNCMNPIAMALTGTARGYSHDPHPWQPEEEKPSKLQTLFHVSITALAFLSFGGYLLCLIVHAIKSKGTTYFHPVATASTTTKNGGVKRIKIYRRGRREATPLLLQRHNTDWVMNYGYANWFSY